MNRNRKCILVLVSMLLLVSILEFFEYINVSKLYNDLNDSIRDDDSDNNDIYYTDIDKDDLTSNGPIYQDEDATEEQIKLFGPLEEKEVIEKRIVYFISTKHKIHELLKNITTIFSIISNLLDTSQHRYIFLCNNWPG